MKVAPAIKLWWSEVQVVNLSTDGATTPASHPLFQQFQRNIDQYCAQLLVLPVGELLKHLRLGRGAGKPIENIAVPTIVLRGPIRSEEHTSELQSHLNLVC